jgi:hypothetical protein
MQFVIAKLCPYYITKRNEFRRAEQLFEENEIRYCPKIWKKKYGLATKSRQIWTGGEEETQYSSVMETGSEGVDWINLGQGVDRSRPLVNTEWILAFH